MTPLDFSAGSQTAKARRLYQISPYAVPVELLRSVLLVKTAAARCNASLGYLESGEAERLLAAIVELQSASDADLADSLALDAFQGGAGTSTHTMVNEAIASLSGLDVYAHVNLHQSTNDVMPTAFRLMLLDKLVALEKLVADAQNAAQEGESKWAAVLIPGHTQLQDASELSAGRVFSTWAASLARDRWRVFKARERLKEVNLGGTAIGTGAGAPRAYALGVIKELQKLTTHPVTRAEDTVEATANYDSVAEAMAVVGVLAQNVRRIAGDIRLLASGPVSGFALLRVPGRLKGSTIMPGKINPVVEEAAIQVSERVMANDSLVARLCSQGELQLNAFFPLIAYTSWESLELLTGILPLLSDELAHLEFNVDKAARRVADGSSASLAFTALLGYRAVETLLRRARERGQSFRHHVESLGFFTATDLEWLFSARTLQGMGYAEDAYAALRERYGESLVALQKELEQQS